MLRLLLQALFASFSFLCLFGASPSLSQELERRYNSEEIQVDESLHDVQFFNFVTRPDIDAPRLDVKVYNEEALSPGYFFVSPYGIVQQTDHEKLYVGPHIYDHAGELVWSGVPFFDGYDTFDFKVSEVFGRPMITTLIPSANHSLILDDTYNVFADIPTGIDKETLNMHEFQVVDNGTRALYLTKELKQTSLENSIKVGFNGSCSVEFTGFEERDLTTGEVTFQWNSEGRIGLEESTMYRGNVTWQCSWDEPWDYLHLNSVEKLPDGDYLLSGRRSYALYKISHLNGDILWRFGGKQSDFEFDGHFSGQHDARCLSQNRTHMIVSFLDNASGPGFPRETNPFSRGLVVALNTKTMVAEEIRHIDHPHEGYAVGRGNFQTLPNGNAFLSWMKSALQSEHTPDGTLVMEASFPSGLKTYRAYKFPWVGQPAEAPEIHSQVVRVGREMYTAVHVSWNGDTEVATWNLYKTNADGSDTELVAAVQRHGFETAMIYPGYAEYVMAEGRDKYGRKLTVSRGIQTLGLANKLAPEAVEEAQWQQEHPAAWDGEDMTKSSASALLHPGMATVFANPIFAFFCGILFCIATGLSAWYICWVRRSGKFVWQRRRRLYAALSDTDEERDGEKFSDYSPKPPAVIVSGPDD